MKIINPSNISNFNSATRIYYNLEDVRILDVNMRNNNDSDLYHLHKTITEILFVIDGLLEIKIKNENKIDTFTVNKNKIIVFDPGESHSVKSVKRNTRIIVFKYVKQNKNLLNLFLNDWESSV